MFACSFGKKEVAPVRYASDNPAGVEDEDPGGFGDPKETGSVF